MNTPRTVAIAAARNAGRILRDRQHTIQSIDFKGATDLVTDVDKKAEEQIIHALLSAFPDHAVLAEESGTEYGDPASTSRWLIDPLDGTTNYAHGFPIYSVSIALEQLGRIEVGVVYVPTLDELFVAEYGRGASLNGHRLAVSSTETVSNAMLSTGFQYDPAVRASNLPAFGRFTGASRAVRRTGSAAIDLSYVAAGRFDGYWESGLNPWDVAAGMLMVEEAGGLVTDYSGDDYELTRQELLATNRHIHSEMIAILSDADATGA